MEAQKEEDQEVKDNSIKRVHFDSQKFTTLMLKKNTTTRWHLQRLIEESHTTITSEPDGASGCHFTAEKHISPHKPAYMDTLGHINSKNEKNITSKVHARQNMVCVG